MGGQSVVGYGQLRNKWFNFYSNTTSFIRFYVSHDIASSEKLCQCLDKKVQDFSVVKQNSNMRISK